LSWSAGAAPGPFADGSAGSPSITFASDTNTGIYRPSADRIAISTNGAFRLSIEDNGQLAVNEGKNTGFLPKFSVYKSQKGDVNYAPFNQLTSFAAVIRSYSTYWPSDGESNGDKRTVGLYVESNNNGGSYENHVVGSHWSPRDAAILAVNGGAVGNQGGTSFFGHAYPYYASSHAYTARCNYSPTSGRGIGYYVDIDGHAFGGENVGFFSRILDNANNTAGCTHAVLNTETTTSNSRTMISFRRNGTSVGSISTTNNATSYNTSSDYRLKENIIELDTGLESINAIRPVRFDWKSGGSSVGFIAHELQTIVPDAVSGEKDAYEKKGIVDENGDPVLDAGSNPQTEPDLEKPIYQGVDSSFLVPHLVKAVQQLSAKCDSLEARLAALENN
jgi:hypothetical protein